MGSKKAGIFPGQGAQFSGMGKDLYDRDARAREMFEAANECLGFRITDIMFFGKNEELTQTRITQPAVFLHSVIAGLTQSAHRFEGVAGHSLGEFSALVVGGALDLLDALLLVKVRAEAMHKACVQKPATMAVVLGMHDEEVEQVCQTCQKELPEGEYVVPANYNTPHQLVISGTFDAIAMASERLAAQGAKKILPIAVAGAFHSPLMAPAKEMLDKAIQKANFKKPHVLFIKILPLKPRPHLRKSKNNSRYNSPQR